MSDDGVLTALGGAHFVCRVDDCMSRGFDFGLGIEAAEGEAQSAGGITGTDIHRLQYMGPMQRTRVAGGARRAGDACLIEQNEHACSIDLGQA